ncbi:MAG: metallophosphoesterase, partial [Ignavibacteria bacterium]|nr:metallophosphoesterase [Ignavibacteria bacterium]
MRRPMHQRTDTLLILASLLLLNSCVSQKGVTRLPDSPLTVIAIGDQGNAGSQVRANASVITDMFTGRHEAGSFDAMIFLGDNFYNTGLNVPKDEVDRKIKAILGPFRVPLEGLGRTRVHAITGNHDYYSRSLVDVNFLFGLLEVNEGPIGLTDKGNKRASAIPWWNYHYGMPADVVFPLQLGAEDSVQFLFFDSALPLRTPPSTWRNALDSLGKILALTGDRPGVRWHILAMHHPFFSVGEHGGYTEWDDEKNAVGYLTQCDRDSNALGWFKNFVNPEDLCTEKYGQMLDSIRAVIHSSGVTIQAVISGHDHSLQLISRPPGGDDGPVFPYVQIVSGAGSEISRVKRPSPPHEFTAALIDPKEKGRSAPGFA